MKNNEESWQHLRDLRLTKQQQEKILLNITTPTTIEKRPIKRSWKLPAVSLLFIIVLSILILSFIQGPTNSPLTTDTNKTIAKVYVHSNENKETFIAKASCLYVPQECYTNKQLLSQLQEQMEHAPSISLTAQQWEANSNSPHDVLIVYSDGTHEKWKVLNNDIFLNVVTEQAIQFDNAFDSLMYYFDDKQLTKFIFMYIFISLSHVTLWLAKKRMPHIERRFVAATVEHAIANAIMLVLFAGILYAIYLLMHSIHATIIYSLFTLYSIMQIYYRKKAGEPRGYLVASAVVQLCIAIAFSLLYLTNYIHY
ncbi:hypothetical protein AMS59_21550 [Lysinibacillus sp. FJAT-14745]|uniref:hypothetical protein n=1 Tax=Lysinibacillus sp. FJAT-14745 TaxID=1704289 RepID=UPI0006ABA834|nr:hypothetical protein [Lysinibacillus sp. FJAT-14745]KOP69890.1 hypothetical protein AMS59_21550 [Lysinibacillus sp. FJAT-14745]